MYVLWHSSEGKLELRGPNLIERDGAGTPAKTGVEELEWPTVSTFPPELEHTKKCWADADFLEPNQP